MQYIAGAAVADAVTMNFYELYTVRNERERIDSALIEKALYFQLNLIRFVA